MDVKQQARSSEVTMDDAVKDEKSLFSQLLFFKKDKSDKIEDPADIDADIDTDSDIDDSDAGVSDVHSQSVATPHKEGGETSNDGSHATPDVHSVGDVLLAPQLSRASSIPSTLAAP